MIILLSPAKRMNYDATTVKKQSIPRFLNQSEEIANKLKKLSPKKIAQLMSINSDLANLNHERYHHWNTTMQAPEAKQAILAFRGDAYLGLDVDTLTEDDMEYANEHVRILSGLYGLLQPSDLIRPYRLEMGTKISIGRKKNLYEFWTDIVTDEVNLLMKKLNSHTIVNLASNEYFKTLDTSRLEGKIITPIFKDKKGKAYKVLFAYAKKARGAMTRYAIDKRMNDPQDLKNFSWDNYCYNKEMSSDFEWVFTRD